MAWFEQHWFSLLQSLGIVGGFAIASRSLSLDLRARKTEVFLTIAQAHRDIWEHLVERPELARILDPTVDTCSDPPSPSEERFVLLILTHLDSVHLAIRNGVLPASDNLMADAAQFFSLPIPKLILPKYLRFQNPAFRQFLTGLLSSPEQNGSLSHQRHPPSRMDPKLKSAMEKLEAAQHLVDDAASDLCSVEGFADQWTELGRLYDTVKKHWHMLDSRRMELEHQPQETES